MHFAYDGSLLTEYTAGRRLSQATQEAGEALPGELADPEEVLGRFVDLCLVEFPKVKRITLFGSRATDKARPDSDYDIALFVHDEDVNDDILSRASDLGFMFLLRGANIRPVVLGISRIEESTHFLNHIRAVGRTLHEGA